MIGARIRRVEDHRLVTGRGRFTDDLTAPGAAFAAFVRSSHAHANVIGIDAGAAHALPGVLGVFDAEDLAAGGVRDHLTGTEGRSRGFLNRDGTPMAAPVWFPLARGRVRHVGEPVAMVVAENAALAEQAAEAVIVDYDPLPAVTDAALALRPGAPRLWDTAPGNLCYDWGRGDMAAVDSALAGAAHVSHLDVVIPRIAAAFMEPRAALAEYDAATGRFTFHVGCQAVHGLRAKLAYGLGVAEGDVRVVSLDVGGAFGARSVIYPEYVPLLWAARALGRPLRWRATRAEEFLTTTQGRDSVLTGELGLDVDGNFVVFPGAKCHQHGCAPYRQRAVLGDAEPRAHAVGRLSHPRLRHDDPGRVHQYAARELIPRRGADGGDLPARAPDRPGRARDRPRPHRVASAEPDRSRCLSLYDADRRLLRQRRLRTGHGSRARRRRLGRVR